MNKKTPKAIPVAGARFRKESASAHEVIYDRINNSLEDMDRALEDLALGVYVSQVVNGEEVRVYRREPNLEALKYRMDRVMGRTVARSEAGQPGEFQGYESFLKDMIAKRQTLIPQEPRVLEPAAENLIKEEEQVRLDREALVRLFLKPSD